MTTLNANSTHTETKSHRSDLTDAASNVREDLTELGKDTKEALSAAGACAKDGLDHAVEIAKTSGEKCKSVHSSLAEQVRQHPTAAVLLTVGAGILVGRMLPRR
jgi:ElaB/YqjD/DUF883 family membrane-anchored ribosome-binding protein